MVDNIHILNQKIMPNGKPKTRSYNIDDDNVIKTLSKQGIDHGMNLKNYVEHILTEVATKGNFNTKTK